MAENFLHFEVSVTPKWKKKIAVDPSPILVLERFKGTPSLLFKEIKVGSSCTKGLWIENPNASTITVSMAKLPPKERGLVFTDTEFNLDANESKRIEVTWSPTCQGSWRDVVNVQVWGLPPPHLSFRVVLHLTSVEPKVRQKCCHANPPLRARNIRTSKNKASEPCGQCCKRNAKKIPSIGSRAIASKENVPDKKLVIKVPTKVTKYTAGIDRDSLEDRILPGEVKQEPFTPMEEGSVLPPCSVPSTPVRRGTYCINGGDSQENASLPSNNSATPNAVAQEGRPRQDANNLRFLQALREPWFSPIGELPMETLLGRNSTQDGTGTIAIESPVSTVKRSHRPNSRGSHTEVKQEIPAFTGRRSPRTLFPVSVHNSASGQEDEWRMPIQSSPVHYGACKSTPPQLSPIGYHLSPSKQRNCSMISVADSCADFDIKTTRCTINYTYTKERSCDVQMVDAANKYPGDYYSIQRSSNWRVQQMETMNKACCVIQKNWRRILAQREETRLRAEGLETMNRACCVIQKNWRRILAQRVAARLRAERLETMSRACCVIQKNWRRILAQRVAAQLRAERLETMNRACCVIQKNWRCILAQRVAARLRAERLETMNKACCVIQKNWRHILAKREAARWRAERLEAMNRACCIIQKNWRLILAKREAARWRAERLEAMNRACCIIQKNWRLILAKREAARWRAERLEAMNRACCIIQKNWRRILAKREAARWRAERLEAMNRACCIIQKNWRLILAKREAARWRAERLEAMNRACCIIQKNWRRILAKREAARWRAERLEAMNRACCVIQTNWRRILAQREAARLRAERLEIMNRACCVIQTNWRRILAQREAESLRAARHKDSTDLHYEIASKICQKFHMKRSVFENLHKAVSSHTVEDLVPVMKAIQQNLRTGLLQSANLCVHHKSTQTGDREPDFRKPTVSSRRKTIHNAANQAAQPYSSSRRSLYRDNSTYTRGPSPLKKKATQKEVPEKERWNSVAEAVGCTPRGK